MTNDTSVKFGTDSNGRAARVQIDFGVKSHRNWMSQDFVRFTMGIKYP